MPQIPNIGSYFSDRVLHLAAKVVTIFGYLGSEDFAGLGYLGSEDFAGLGYLGSEDFAGLGYLGSEDFAGLYALGFPVGSKVSSGLLDLLLDVRR